ncbi:hypothetical protein Trydic_g1910 [Trypoxylus dichotomus]
MAFKDGREAIEYDHRPGEPSALKTYESVAKVVSVLTQDRWLTLRLNALEISISKNTVHRIVTKGVGMRKIFVQRGRPRTSPLANNCWIA